MRVANAFVLVCFAHSDKSDTTSMLQTRLNNSDRINRQQDLVVAKINAGRTLKRVDGSEKVIVNLEDLQEVAEEKMTAYWGTRHAYEYYEGGALDLTTWKANVEAWQKIQTWPRYLVNVSTVDPSHSFLDSPMSMPVIIPPMALQKLANFEVGEIGLAQAAADANIPFTISESSSISIQDICKAVPYGPKMFQMYVSTIRKQSEILLKRAEACGPMMKAIVVTVDAPVPGRRERDIRNVFSPKGFDGIDTVNRVFPELEEEQEQEQASVQGDGESDDAVKENFAWRGTRDAGLNWDDIKWMKQATSLPLIMKGLQHPEDAKLAVKYGVGVWVSNHGGRQLDEGPATAEALAGVVAVAKGKVPVVVDSGIRRGSHVLKAMSIGADAVAIGRPMLFGLAANGTQGAAKAMSIMMDEIKSNMALTGVTKISQLNRNYVRLPGEPLPAVKPCRKTRGRKHKKR